MTNLQKVEQKQDCFRHLVSQARAGEIWAMEEIASRFRPLVMTVAARYRDVSFDDAMQEGYLALMECVHNFDVDRGVPFAGYVNLKLRGDVRTAMRRAWRYESRIAQSKVTPSGEDDATGYTLPDWRTRDDISDLEWKLVLGQTGLSPREILGLETLMNGVSSTVVASREGVSTDTVKTWRKRGIAKLRKGLVRPE